MSMLTPGQRYKIVAQAPDPKPNMVLPYPYWLRSGEVVRELFTRQGLLVPKREGPKRAPDKW
uniref:Uncharacterized protein n=1 Tax=Xanthomonas phage MK21 TaxID=3148942 RepID=A0AAU7J855_9CAUD